MSSLFHSVLRYPKRTRRAKERYSTAPSTRSNRRARWIPASALVTLCRFGKCLADFWTCCVCQPRDLLFCFDFWVCHVLIWLLGGILVNDSSPIWVGYRLLSYLCQLFCSLSKTDGSRWNQTTEKKSENLFWSSSSIFAHLQNLFFLLKNLVCKFFDN